MIKDVALVYADIRASENEYGDGEFSLGVSILSAVLKSKGYNVLFVHILKDLPWEEFSKIEAFHQADLVGISYLSFGRHVVKKWPAWIKKIKDVPVVAGGIHPTLNPDEVIQLEGLDMLIVGEADLTLPRLLEAFNGKCGFDEVPSLWRKENGSVLKNNERKVIESLDELPYVDTDIYNFKRLLSSAARLSYLPYFTSRGCPYNCFYCSNHYLKSLHPGGHAYVRQQSVDRTIGEIKYLLDKHPHLKTVCFNDDMFNMSTKWLEEFAERYPAEIGLPFRVLIRIDRLTEHQAALMKKSGCFRASFGIESGSPNIRRNILNRNMSNEKIIEGSKILRKAGIHGVSYNLVGVPEETIMDIQATIKLNARCDNEAAFCSIFHPHANTQLYNICKEKGYLSDRFYKTVFEGSIVNLPALTETDIKFVHRLFRSFVYIYKGIYNLPRPLSSILEPLVDMLFYMPQGMKKLMIKIHDRWFNGFLINREYQNSEKDLVKGKTWEEKKETL